jgi:hypothetical protein
VVFAFVNNNHLVNTNVAATYDLNAKVPGADLNYFGIDRGRSYNVRDLLADNSNSFVWPTNRTGADLIDNGLFVGLPNTNAGTGSHHAQYLQLVDVSTPGLSFISSTMTFGTTNTLNASATPPAPVIYSLVGGDTNKVTLNGDKLAINSGTGSVVVRAVVEATADRPAATNQATITFAKAPQTINFLLSQPSVAAGTSVSLNATASSTLPVSYSSSSTSVATISGGSANALAAGQTTITATQAGNDNYLAATSVDQVLEVTSSGPSFESLFPGQAADSDVDGDGVPALAEYALNGSTNSNDIGKLPQIEDGAVLAISAVVRTNDARLTTDAVTSANLSGGWNGPVVEGTVHSDQSGVTNGFQRRRYFIDGSTNNQSFIRMRFRLSPANP